MHIETLTLLALIVLPIVIVWRKVKVVYGDTYVFETPRDAWEYGKDRVFGE